MGASVSNGLLPSNSTPFERSMEGAMSRLSNVPVPLRTVYNVDQCPANLLPWLAQTMQVGQWNTDWPESVKRAVIAGSVGVHKRKGTIAAIREFFASIGFGDITIDEGRNAKYDGTYHYDGFNTYGNSLDWAYYRIRFNKLLSNAQADQARAVLAVIAPLRCHLLGLDFTGAALIHNATANYDGSYSYGVA